MRRTFTLPDGRKATTSSARRYVVIDVGDRQVMYRTDDKARADRYARRNARFMVFS